MFNETELRMVKDLAIRARRDSIICWKNNVERPPEVFSKEMIEKQKKLYEERKTGYDSIIEKLKNIKAFNSEHLNDLQQELF